MKFKVPKTGIGELRTPIKFVGYESLGPEPNSTVDEKVLLALQNKIDLAKNLIDDYKNGVNPYAMGGN